MFKPTSDLSNLELIAERQVLSDIHRALHNRIQSLASCSTELGVLVQDFAIEESTRILTRLTLISDELSDRTSCIDLSRGKE